MNTKHTTTKTTNYLHLIIYIKENYRLKATRFYSITLQKLILNLTKNYTETTKKIQRSQTFSNITIQLQNPP